MAAVTVPERVQLARLHPAPWNPRTLTDERFKNLCRSIEADPDFLTLRPIIATQAGEIVGGNMRYRAVEHLGWTDVPALLVEMDDQLAKERALRDNGSWGEWQEQELAELLSSLQQSGSDVDLLGVDTAELERLLASVSGTEELGEDAAARPSLADQFGVPPFSVLDARQGYWQDRKRHWLAFGIQSELGRGDVMPSGAASVDAGSSEWADYRGPARANGLLGFSEQARSHYATPGGSPRHAASLGPDGKTRRGDGKGRGLARTFGQDLMRGEHVVGQNVHMARPPHGLKVTQARDGTLQYRPSNSADGTQSGTSVFDPVLCELAYRWFSPPEAFVLDPFAGGSVRGIIASKLGRSYVGVDLRPEQIEANREQAARICDDPQPVWTVGDSRDIATLAPGAYDLIFSCPPYADLERYSDDPRDISTMDYPAFLALYRSIIADSVGLLKPDRFACFVVGDVRDPKGLYRNFVSDTIAAFHDAGAHLYNEAILVTSLGSLPIRVGRQFSAGRKLGKTHQNVLVFVKGDPRKATEACGPVEVAMPSEDFGEELQ